MSGNGWRRAPAGSPDALSGHCGQDGQDIYIYIYIYISASLTFCGVFMCFVVLSTESSSDNISPICFKFFLAINSGVLAGLKCKIRTQIWSIAFIQNE